MGIVTLNNMKVIFLLKHTNYTNFDGKNIGYFSSYEKARSACLTVSHQLGFRDYPNDFEIICVPLYHQKDQLPKHAYELVKSTELDDVEKTYYLGIFWKRVDAERHKKGILKEKKSQLGVYRIEIDRIYWEEGFISVEEASSEFL